MSILCWISFFFNDTATTEIYTLSLHDALPIASGGVVVLNEDVVRALSIAPATVHRVAVDRSEEHTSELQSRFDLVCRLLLEKKKQTYKSSICFIIDYPTLRS